MATSKIDFIKHTKENIERLDDKEVIAEDITFKDIKNEDKQWDCRDVQIIGDMEVINDAVDYFNKENTKFKDGKQSSQFIICARNKAAAKSKKTEDLQGILIPGANEELDGPIVFDIVNKGKTWTFKQDNIDLPDMFIEGVPEWFDNPIPLKDVLSPHLLKINDECLEKNKQLIEEDKLSDLENYIPDEMPK